MPQQYTYPGVYVEEIPSGVHTITGVATSITAFAGRALRGPTDTAVTINSYADFERLFGGLWIESTMSYAVRDFFLNGGSQAIIIRLYKLDGTNNDTARITVAGITLEAASPGAWGNNLRAIIDTDVEQDVVSRMSQLFPGLKKEHLFNLTVQEIRTTIVDPAKPENNKISILNEERIPNITLVPSPRRIDKVLVEESDLVRWSSTNTLDLKQTTVTGETPAGFTAVASSSHDLQAAQDKQLAAKTSTPATSTTDLKALVKAVSDQQTALAKVNSALVGDSGKAFDGAGLDIDSFLPPDGEVDKAGVYALEQADLFNMLCIPPYDKDTDIEEGLVSAAIAYCERRRAMFIADPPLTWRNKEKAKSDFRTGGRFDPSKNAAVFFPRLLQPNQLRNNQVEEFAPCGAVAGVFARTDAERGVWKAPAGINAVLKGVPQLSVNLTDAENGELNQLGINCLRAFPVYGRVVWGARTLRGADQLADDYKYIPVRRLALFIEESLYRGMQWAVFEPNDEPLWAQIRLNVGAFMHNLFRQGAFQGQSPRDAYLVKCDKETTTQNDINLGVVNVVVAFAPLKPAEFVVIQLQQLTGQIEV